MRLIKLLAYALLGYVIYELFRGMSEQPQTVGWRKTGARSRRGSRDLERALNEDTGRMNVTGTGHGTSVSSQETTGASRRHTVGRGVIPE